MDFLFQMAREYYKLFYWYVSIFILWFKNVVSFFTGSFEVEVNDKLIYSKLQTMALPDYDEVAQVVNDVSQGSEPREIKGQQPINCAIS